MRELGNMTAAWELATGSSRVKAVFRNGMHEIVLPKKEEDMPQGIKIDVK